MIPGISCPACWPAYAGLLSSVGIGFFNYTPYLLPLTLIFLAVALVALGYRAKTRHGYYTLMLGAAGSVLLVFGKFLLSNNYILYSGIGIIVGASTWNSLPSRAACPACSDTEFHQINNNK